MATVFGRRVPVHETLHGTLVERGDGRSRLRYPVLAAYTNSGGTLNGGMFAVVADTAMAIAAQGIATASMQVNFLRPAPTGSELVIDAEVVRAGRRIVYAEATVRDAEGRLLARVNQTGLARERTEDGGPPPMLAPPDFTAVPVTPSDTDIPLLATLGAEILEQGDGRAALRVRFDEAHTNPLGQMQGGMFAVLLDNAMGLASRPLTTLELQANLLRPAFPGQTVVARGEVVRAGRRVIYAEAEVRDEGGVLLARGSQVGIPRETPE